MKGTEHKPQGHIKSQAKLSKNGAHSHQHEAVAGAGMGTGMEAWMYTAVTENGHHLCAAACRAAVMGIMDVLFLL